LRGRAHKEISVRNLSAIIQARMEEIVEHVYYEIKNSGYEKKLIAGIVITGGGAQLKHITQLVEYITGMDSRIGYPNEHLAKGSVDVTSPMFATSVGLVMKGLQTMDKQNQKNLATSTSSTIKGHSKDKSSGFFDKLKSFFDEDSIQK
jgi:cell division protein FtsA